MGPMIDGGSAFPTDQSNSQNYTDLKGGLTFRDYFAAHATLGDVLLAEEALLEAHTAGGVEVDPLTLRIKARYAVADAMLRIRGEW